MTFPSPFLLRGNAVPHPSDKKPKAKPSGEYAYMETTPKKPFFHTRAFSHPDFQDS
jgi:hypothetical protein